MGARHFSCHGQAACWPGRPLVYATDIRRVTCGSCRRTRAYKDALEARLSGVWLRNGQRSVRKKIARILAASGDEVHPLDVPVIAVLIERLAA
jgi:hypothetical protein